MTVVGSDDAVVVFVAVTVEGIDEDEVVKTGVIVAVQSKSQLYM
jgi:hypothetical protein